MKWFSTSFAIKKLQKLKQVEVLPHFYNGQIWDADITKAGEG